MAPITRSSVHGRPATKSRNSLQALNTNGNPESMHGFSSDDENNFEEDNENASPFRSAQDMLLPLQETANRVSRQVEDFAKELDKFKSSIAPSEQGIWDQAIHLIKQYAQSTDTRAQQMAQKGRNASPDNGSEMSDLKLEGDLWTLMGSVLVCKCPKNLQQANDAAESSLGDLHRYSLTDAVWNAFLDSDPIAQEYEVILGWLQERAAEESPPLEALVEDLVKRSERGDGIWSAGLIYTKDAIKKQKRSRAWPMPLDPSNPGLKTTHLREEDEEFLVTQMDLDAATREGAVLVKPDDYHEEAAWQICYEMLRRGTPPFEIEQWWKDRKEMWRTALLTGGEQSEKSHEAQFLHIMNIAFNHEWYARCQAMSQTPIRLYEYERAVYGILSGEHQTVVPVCKTIEDVLYSYFNAVLIERYSDYISAYKHKLQNPRATNFTPALSSFSVIQDYLSRAQMIDQVKDEFDKPHEYITAALLSQDFDHFFVQQGHAAAQTAHMTDQSAHLILPDNSSFNNEHARIAARDQDAVRIIAHLQLVLRCLGFLDKVYQENTYQMDNNIVNYIGFLERDAKFSLLPLYASKLDQSRAAHVLGTILNKVTDRREREHQVKLMKSYDIDHAEVIFGIFQLANYNELQMLKKIKDISKAPKIIHYVEANGIKLVKIRTDFMGGEPTPAEITSIQAAEWMRFMDAKNWGSAVWAVSALYKIFLVSGKLAAARELLRNVPLAGTSLAAVGMNLNLSTEFEDGEFAGDVDMQDSNGSIDGPIQPVSPARKRLSRNNSGVHPLARHTTNREELADQSRVWAQLEQLVDALWALERWQGFADEVEEIRGELGSMRTAKRELKQALQELQNAMLFILDPDFLTVANDDTEAELLKSIRHHYIPDIILGYNSALYFAGHALTRNYLVECMNLAQECAQNSMLTEAFVESKRMRELVMAFALDSQALLRANEAGPAAPKSKKGQKDGFSSEGKGDIWQVTWREDIDADLEGLE